MIASNELLEFDLADRMRKALRVADIGVQDVAETLQVSRTAVSRWINGRNVPRPRDLAAFAELTGVPVYWLETGKAPDLRPEAISYTPRDLNPEPTD